MLAGGLRVRGLRAERSHRAQTGHMKQGQGPSNTAFEVFWNQELHPASDSLFRGPCNVPTAKVGRSLLSVTKNIVRETLPCESL